MSLYKHIYDNLCAKHSRPISLEVTHLHHIVPRHANGQDDQKNLVRLTIREHIICHFLLWKINRNPNDLRAMHMLGAKLSKEQRKATGEFCRDNRLGFFKATLEQRRKWALRGYESQKQKAVLGSFYWWGTPEGRKKRASLGGTASFKSGNNKKFLFWASDEGRKKRSSLGGKSHINKHCMYIPGDKTFIRVSSEKVIFCLEQGYIFGSPIVSPTKGNKTNKISPRRRKVTDGKVVYESVHHAATSERVTSSCIVLRCKSLKSRWEYVS